MRLVQLLEVVFCTAALSASAAAADVRVLATGVFASSLRDLVVPFERQTGHILVPTITNAGGVLARVAAHEEVDVVMTSSAGIDTLIARGDVSVPSKVEVARMRLGAAVRTGAAEPDLTSEAAFRAALLAAPTVAYIDPNGGGTSGAFFETMLARLGLADAVHVKAVLCATGEDVATAVASGRATLGMTQSSELLGAPGLAFVGFLPEGDNLTTPYAAAIATKAQAPQAAAALIGFMTGPTGTARLREAGWDVDR